MSNEYVNFTPQSFLLFKKAFFSALEHGQPSFYFEDKEFLVEYSRYVVEYLETTYKLNT